MHPITRRTISFTLFASSLVLWCGEARAYRPFDGTDADVAKEGEYEVEIGPGYLRQGDDRFGVLPWMINNLGIAKGHELVLEGKHVVALTDPGPVGRSRVVGTGFFLKSMLRRGSMQEETGPSVASEIGALLPQVNDDHALGASLAVIVSQRWKPVAMHINMGNALSRDRHYVLFVGAIVEGPSEWPVRPVAEVFLERSFEGGAIGDGLVRSALVGAIYRFRDSLSFDAGLRVAREGEQSAFEVRAGLTFGLSLWGKN